MLRARLLSNGRQQVITSDVDTSLAVMMHEVEDIGAISAIAERSHSAVNIQTGPVISLDIIHVSSPTKNEQYALFIGHHMVIDLVSWKVLLGDIQDLLLSKGVATTSPVPFQRWVDIQRAHNQGPVQPEDVLPFDVHRANYHYWGFSPECNTFGEACHREFLVDETTTGAIFGSANKALDSQPQELLQVALLHAWATVFRGRRTPTIFTESHGRAQPFDPALDLSHTVGWFTTLRPCTVEVGDNMDWTDIVRRMKDTSRSLNAVSYFSARYLNPQCRVAFADHAPAEILLNFAGRSQQWESQEESIFSAASGWKPDPNLDVAANLPRFAIFDVVVELIQRQLHVSVWYCKHSNRQEGIQRWIRQYQRSLGEVAKHLSGIPPRLTLSNIMLAPMTYDQLSALDQEIRWRLDIIPCVSSIEAIYPCLDAHRGLIQGLTGNTTRYVTRIIWEIQCKRKSVTIDAPAVADAWRRLIQQHAILRTSLVGSPMDGRIFHIVLKDPPADVHILPQLITSYDDFHQHLPPLRSWDHSPAHRFAVGQTVDGRILVRLDAGKAYIDGISLSILLRQLSAELLGEESPRGAFTYWNTTLAGMSPCLFPALVANIPGGRKTPVAAAATMHTVQSVLPQPDRLNAFWRSNCLTVTNIFQLAWALVLQYYCHSPDVCFGSVVSGRDMPLPDIAHIVGPCINVLPCRLALEPNQTVIQWLRQNQVDMDRRLEHQHCSTPDTLRAAGFRDAHVFNTSLSVQSPLYVHFGHIQFHLLENHDPSEFDLCLVVFWSSDQVDVHLRYYTSLCTTAQANQTLDLFLQAVEAIMSHSEKTLLHLKNTLNMGSDGAAPGRLSP